MLLEALISLGIICTMLIAVTVFALNVTTANRQHADTQIATQLAVSGMERISLLSGTALLVGRTEANVRNQERAPGTAFYLDPAQTQLVWDQSDSSSQPADFSLPTQAEAITIGGMDSQFRRLWYVGVCWRPATDGDCTVAPAQQRSNLIRMYRVVIAVTWPARGCTNGICSYVAATLRTAITTDPTFGL
jgi:type II secretory pathway pseudopilin PulG